MAGLLGESSDLLAWDIPRSDYPRSKQAAARIEKMDRAIEEVARSLPPRMRAVL